MSRVPTLRLVALLAAPVLVAVTLTSCGSPPKQDAGALPFELNLDALRASPRKVFAHYMPSMPMSYDNKDKSSDYWTRNYMNPDGESGKHAAYGGFTRDAPLGRGVTSGDYRILNMETEVRQAMSAGIDGFAVDLLTLQVGNQNYDNTLLLLQAAENVDPDFSVMLIPDMSSTTGNLSAPDLAGWLATLAESPAAYRLNDGRLVISPFKAEIKDAAYYSQLISVMKSAHGIDVAFVPIFLDERPYLSSFGPISYGMSVWGNRNPAGNPSYDGGNWDQRAKAVHNTGAIWMQSVSYQDERPRHEIYDEAQNATNLRQTWDVARATEAEWVQMITWNDYAEGTQIAPSDKHGWAPLDINAYYLSWYKTGNRPTITKDTVYVTHRPQPLAALPSYPQTQLMDLRGGSSPGRDTVEALSFLTAASTVSVTTGGVTTTCNAPAGVSSCTVPLGLGSVTAKATRGGTTTAIVTSPFTVTNKPYTQDFQYLAASSGREGGVEPSPGPTVTATPPSGAQTITLGPVADTYGNQGAPDANYGDSSSLASRGNLGYQSYLRFAVPTAPTGTALVSATLSVNTSDLGEAGSAEAHQVKVADNNWDEATLTWNKRPATTSTQLGEIKGATALNTRYATALSVSGVAALAGTQATLTVTSTGTDSLWFWSGQHVTTSVRPQLILKYETVATPEPSTVTLVPVADAYGNEGAKDANYGGSSSLAVRGSLGYQSYLRFAVPAAPAGTALVSATLSVNTSDLGESGSAEAHQVKVADNNWDEATLTWNKRPATTSTQLGEIKGATALNTRYATSLSVSGVAALAGTQATLTVTSTGTDSLWFWSSEHVTTSVRPQLILKYEPVAKPEPSTVTLVPVADAYGNEGAKDANYGGSSSLAVRGSLGYQSYLRFAVPAAPAGTALVSATLSVNTSDLGESGSAEAHQVKVADNNWDEATLTWNKRPATTSTQLGEIKGATALNTRYATSLSVSGVAALAGTQATLTVTSTGTDSLWFWSSEHVTTSVRPQLILKYE